MTALLRVSGVSKAFTGVQALSGVDLSVDAGEVHALLGQNGAGKSTLMKVIAGDIVPDEGTVEVDGDVRHRLPGAQPGPAALGRARTC